MKICVFGTRGFPGIQGGVEQHGGHLYPRLPGDCQLVVFRRRPYVQAHDSFPRIRVIDLPSTRLKGFEAAFHSFLAAILSPFLRPDLVHIHNIGPGCFAPILRLVGIPVVLTFHSPNYEHAKWGPLARLLLRASESIALRCATAIIFVNSFQMRKYPPAIQAKSRYIPNGVDLAPPPTRADTLAPFGLEPGRYILAVGRLTPEKGFDLLIEAFRQLAPPGLTLVIAGGVDNENTCSLALRDLARGLPVVFTGALNGEPLRQLYAHARLFVLPSRNEGFPLVLLEAMAAGRDVLVRDLSATRLVSLSPDDFFTGDNDLLPQLQRKLARPLPPVRRYELAAFDWDLIAVQTCEVYATATAAPAPLKA